MNGKHQVEDIDMYVSSKIKPNWLRAYENGNFGDDFPPDLQASQTTDSSKEFMANIFNRIGNKQNYQKPVVSTDGVMPATQFMMMPPQNIPINNVSRLFVAIFVFVFGELSLRSTIHCRFHANCNQWSVFNREFLHGI